MCYTEGEYSIIPKKFLSKKLRVSFFAIFLSFFPLACGAEYVSLAEWTFPNNPDDALVDSGISENETEILEVSGATNLTFSSSGASTNAARATGWQTGAENKFWHTRFSTEGYQNVSVSVTLRSSATGPKDFVLQYRLAEDEAWQSVIGGVITVNDSFAMGRLELLPLPDETADKEKVFIRLLMATDVSVNSSMVAATGANRLDDLVISASPLDEEPTDPVPGDQCAGEHGSVSLNEILPYPAISNQEYAELFNNGEQCVNISGWRVEDGGNHRYIFPIGIVIESGEYLTLVQNFFLNNTSPDFLRLYDETGNLVSEAGYDVALKGFSLSFDGENWIFSSLLTPGAPNEFDETAPEEESAAVSGVILSEIFPNPFTDEAALEFVEVYNPTDQLLNVSGWSIKDASGKSFIFPSETVLEVREHRAFYRSDFTFSLNNTGTESVTLLNALGEIQSFVEFSRTEENFSLSFDGKKWHWTKKVTPNAVNMFSKLPKVTLTSSKKGFIDVPLSFRIKVENGKKPYRYSWDFGDGRKSSLPEPKHTFEKAGNYTVLLKLKTKDQTVQKEFGVEIKKFPKIPLLITALYPNPKGKDLGKEWVEVKNLSSQKINLLGWKLATGNDELTNHAIKINTFLQPKETVRLTRDQTSFSLANTESTVELRTPANDAVSTVRYEEERIPEESTCINSNGICTFLNDDRIAKEEKVLGVETLREEELSESSVTQNENHIIMLHAPSKKILLQRIGNDANLLLNQLITDRLYSSEK